MRYLRTRQNSSCCCPHYQWRKTSEPVPVVAIKAQNITLPWPCWRGCFGSWPVPSFTYFPLSISLVQVNCSQAFLSQNCMYFMYFLANSDLAILFLRLLSGLLLAMNHVGLCCCKSSLYGSLWDLCLRTSWRVFLIFLTVEKVFFFKIKKTSTTLVFHGIPYCLLLLSSPLCSCFLAVYLQGFCFVSSIYSMPASLALMLICSSCWEITASV